MKATWLLALVATALFAVFSGGVARAQEEHVHHWDEHNPRFDEHDHQAVNDWWARHHDHPVVGFRAEDRLPADWLPRLQIGFVLTPDWRAHCHPVPPDLLAELPPPPPHYRYYVIGGNIILVDHDWRVADVISIHL
jgi:Ni/Co efflux regulator RcnB